MAVRPIATDEDHRQALAEIEILWGAPAGSTECELLDVSLALVEAYEAQRWPIDGDDSRDGRLNGE